MKKIILIITLLIMNVLSYAQKEADSIPADIIENLSQIGTDDNPLLNQYESQILNYYFQKAGYVGTIKNIDFTNLRVAFFRGNVGTVEFYKKLFFKDIKDDIFSSNEYYMCWQLMLFSKENVEIVKYDAAIIYCNKKTLNKEKEIVKLLKKNHRSR